MTPTPQKGELNQRLPSFLVVGADPPDVEWLLRNLVAHPEVYVVALGSSYFSNPKRTRALGADWYASQFEPNEDEHVVGEVTLEYMLWRNRPGLVARKIARVLPDARIIAVLRHPVDRLLMQWKAMQSAGQVREDRLVDRIASVEPGKDPTCLVSGGWYGASLAPYRRLFGDQLLVVVHDELSEDPRGAFGQVLRHIGADPSFEPVDVDIVASAELELPQLSDEERATIDALYRHDLRRLETLIGRDLPGWNPRGRKTVLWTWALPGQWASASTWVQELVSNVTPDHYGLATPCREWNVGQLLEHMIGVVRDGIDKLTDSPHEWGFETLEHPADAYREVAGEFSAAIEDDSAMPETVGPENRVASRILAYEVFAHHVVYGWDLAVATGQPAEIPNDVSRAAQRFLLPLLDKIDRRPDTIDVAVTVTADATPTEEFVALLGRDPAAWRRPQPV